MEVSNRIRSVHGEPFHDGLPGLLGGSGGTEEGIFSPVYIAVRAALQPEPQGNEDALPPPEEP